MSARRDAALAAIEDGAVLTALAPCSPLVVSTIMVGLDIDDSDIDIICSHPDLPWLANFLRQQFQHRQGFTCRVMSDHLVARFSFDGFIFEIYGSALPVTEQAAFRHFQVMEKVVAAGGNRLQEEIRQLKRQGMKTEPAIATLFGLTGDPYKAVLDLNNWSQQRILDGLESRWNA